MARKNVLKIVIGILVGVFFSQIFITTKLIQDMCLSKRISSEYLLALEEERSSNKSLLFVGVMTASRYLDTRAKAVYDTWGQLVPGKITFFSSEYSYSEHVPLIALKGVDDSYPPQRKSFTMLKYMYDHYIDQYEWFLRADDDVYIRPDKLEELLRSVDSRKAWFIGQTGRGNSEEFGLLSLDSDENFCMGGPGVILSRETLKKMAPYVDECLKNLYTTHEDVELGRCVRKYAGISCTWSYEMQVIFYHNQSGEAAFSGDLKQKEVHRAITLHPVKKPEYMYRLHNYLKGLQIQANQQESLHLHRDIAASMSELNYRIERLNQANLSENLPLFPDKRGSKNYLGDTKLLGVDTQLNRYTPDKLTNVLDWELISKSIYSYRDFNPRKRLGSSFNEGLNDVVREIMELINSYSKQRGRVIDFKEILYGYWRLDLQHGVDLILDLLLVYRKYRGHKMTVHVRRHSYIQQTFTGIYVKEIDTSLTSSSSNSIKFNIVQNLYSKLFRLKQPKQINFILPLSGRFETFRRFFQIYEEVCSLRNERTKLFVILYRDSLAPDDYVLTKDYVRSKDSVEIVLANGTFSRGRALQIGVNKLQGSDLMVFIDVDIVFDKDFLERVRKNTQINRSLYFPIVYSLYNPKLLANNSNMNYKKLMKDWENINDFGFWRQFGFGIASLYKQDYERLGGFNLSIKGWGNEDVTFYNNAIKSKMKIVRSIDPGLVHVFHPVQCNSDLDMEQKNMCLGTKASTLGSLKTLQKYYLEYQHLFR